ncbi:MAG: hypothetical protein JWN76_3609 [Chitinophagaceae bacterium]|nr:hypothetical protein [Chitinophagaceae bacterium]
MPFEELKSNITAIHPPAVFDETGEWLNIIVEAKEWKEFANQ